jgi:TusE/DsrC/DsvC family sulfur relay protein
MRTGDELAMNAHTPSEDWPERDEHGHLVEACTWESSLAEAMAAADGIELSRRHWQVIEVLREFYAEYEIAPPMRALVKILRERLNESLSVASEPPSPPLAVLPQFHIHLRI